MSDSVNSMGRESDRRSEKGPDVQASDFRTFIDTISDLALVAKLDGRIIFGNEALGRRLGHDENSLAQMRILDLVPAAHREGTEGMVAAILRVGQTGQGIPLAATDGSHVQVLPRAWHGRWEGATCLFCVFRDLSTQSEARHQFECMFRDSPSLMALSSLPDRRFVDINDASLDRLGYAKTEVIGKTSLELGLFPNLEQWKSLTEKIQSDEHIADFEVQIRQKDGKVLDGILSGDAITNGGLPFLLTRIVDITERKRAEKTLRDTNSELKACSDSATETALQATTANRAKSEFLAKMSHEIRTPMNAVVGFTELLLMTKTTDEQREYLDIVKQRGLDLLRIIDDILDLARIEADQVHLADEPFGVHAAVANSLDAIRLTAERKGLVLRSAVAEDVPAELYGDPVRLRQVLLNLLSNAVKFTAQGSVDLRVERVKTANRPQCGLRFTVADTGIGIAPSRQGLIFEPFIQAESTTAKNYGGTGLGLTICRRLVEKMGGTIGVESECGQGSVFSFTAFFEQRADLGNVRRAPSTSLSPEKIRVMRILLVEDDPTSRMLAATILRKDGHKVEEACEGESALHAARKQDFDLVLMDVSMPVMDGLTATKAIRAMAADPDPEVRRRSRVPIVAVTALAMNGDAERCLEAGMNHYLAKPVRPDRLRACLSELGMSAG